MDNLTEYCSFVSVDYIICECGETFPNEDELKVHLDSDHASPKEESEPVVITEKLPEAEPIVYLEPNDFDGYFLGNETECETIEVYNPEDIKQEITVEYVDEDNEYEQKYSESESVKQEVVIDFEPEVPNPLGNTQVVFKRSQLDNQMVIIVNENEEHDYDRESKPSCDDFYFCDVCGKCFEMERSVRLHMRNKHNVGDGGPSKKAIKTTKTSICDVCGKKYTMWQQKCSGCGAKRPTSLSHQRALANKERNLDRYTCDVCGVTRFSNAALRYHQRTHTGEKPYQCTMCPKAFTMPLFLQLHTRTHTGERPYQCPLCPKAFANQAALVRHNRVHSGAKPYACVECGREFSQSNNLKFHYNTVHLKLPPPPRKPRLRRSASHKQRNVRSIINNSPDQFTDVLQEAFGKADGFCGWDIAARFRLVHTGVKPYPCPECGKAFTQSNSMKLHYQTVHLKLPAPYKSAARKLRDAQKVVQRLGASKIVLHNVPSEAHRSDIEVPPISSARHSLLFRHRKRSEEQQYSYVIEPMHCVIEQPGTFL